MAERHKKPKPCHWEPERGWLTPEHERGCDDRQCAGCKPCPETHCAMRGRCPSHVEAEVGLITCPGCIGKVRTDLAAIEDLYALADTAVEARSIWIGALLGEVEEAGVDSEAFNLIGPAASHEQWSERRRRLIALYDARGWCDYPRHEGMAEDDPHHPYVVLGRWELALRESYGPETQLFITVASAKRYLTDQLAGPFPHSDEFEDFAGEIARCRTHLEAVVHDSRAPEVGRPCPRCAEEHGKAPRLRKRYARHLGASPGELCPKRLKATVRDEARRGWCSWPRAYLPAECSVCEGKDDTWHCPDVGEHWWTDHDYRERVAVDYKEHASHLPGRELAERIGVSYAKVRKWAAREWDADAEEWIPPRLVSRRRGPDGRKLYRVADALRLAEEQGKVGA